MAIHVWKVGLDIVDRRHIQKIRTFHDQHRTFFFPEFHPNKLYGRKSDRIRAKWRTGGKNSHPSVTTKPRWTYRRAPGIPDRFRKFPDQPQIIIRLDFPQCIRILIFRQKMDFCPGIRKITLSRNPEFLHKIRSYIRDLLYLHCSFSPSTNIITKATARIAEAIRSAFSANISTQAFPITAPITKKKMIP